METFIVICKSVFRTAKDQRLMQFGEKRKRTLHIAVERELNEHLFIHSNHFHVK